MLPNIFENLVANFIGRIFETQMTEFQTLWEADIFPVIMSLVEQILPMMEGGGGGGAKTLFRSVLMKLIRSKAYVYPTYRFLRF